MVILVLKKKGKHDFKSLERFVVWNEIYIQKYL